MSFTAAPPRTLASMMEPQERARATAWKRTVRSLLTNRVAVLGIVILLTMTVAAIFAPAVAPYDPEWQERADRLVPPLTRSADSGNFYLLGTDPLGRDILSRIIYGARISLMIGFLSVAVSAPVGVLLRPPLRLRRQWLDDAIMRLADIQLAFPFILLAMVIVVGAGAEHPEPDPGPRHLGLGDLRPGRPGPGDSFTPDGVRAVGAGGGLHLEPGPLPPSAAECLHPGDRLDHLRARFDDPASSRASASWALGVQPPTPSWGGMLNESRNYIGQAWWSSVMPGAAIMLTVLSVNFLGDWLRDILDPKEQGK